MEESAPDDWLLKCLSGIAFDGLLSDAYIRGIMNRLDDKMAAASDTYNDYALPSYDEFINPSKKESEKQYDDAIDELARSDLSIRDQEFLEHSSLFSKNLQSDGQGKSAGKARPTGKPTMKPIFGAKSEKSDNVLPAYCNPPNPCPIGYTSDDGCLEEFENTAAFSRQYQIAQDCMCDTEHMFDCPSSNTAQAKNAKSMAATNMVDKAIRKIMSEIQDNDNPYLQGDKLPIAAKKGDRINM
nr:EOG090X0DEG [Leptodora kindtii]